MVPYSLVTDRHEGRRQIDRKRGKQEGRQMDNDGKSKKDIVAEREIRKTERQ
jgi:hypothetical protein